MLQGSQYSGSGDLFVGWSVWTFLFFSFSVTFLFFSLSSQLSVFTCLIPDNSPLSLALTVDPFDPYTTFMKWVWTMDDFTSIRQVRVNLWEYLHRDWLLRTNLLSTDRWTSPCWMRLGLMALCMQLFMFTKLEFHPWRTKEKCATQLTSLHTLLQHTQTAQRRWHFMVTVKLL